MSIYCEVKTPQYKNGLVDYFLYQTGYIDEETWLFRGNKHNIHFRTEEAFLKALVKYL